jgi:hypothetical protein
MATWHEYERQVWVSTVTFTERGPTHRALLDHPSRSEADKTERRDIPNSTPKQNPQAQPATTKSTPTLSVRFFPFSAISRVPCALLPAQPSVVRSRQRVPVRDRSGRDVHPSASACAPPAKDPSRQPAIAVCETCLRFGLRFYPSETRARTSFKNRRRRGVGRRPSLAALRISAGVH